MHVSTESGTASSHAELSEKAGGAGYKRMNGGNMGAKERITTNERQSGRQTERQTERLTVVIIHLYTRVYLHMSICQYVALTQTSVGHLQLRQQGRAKSRRTTDASQACRVWLLPGTAPSRMV